MLPKSLCFVDVETTGTNPSFNRIIEVGIVKVLNNQIVETFESLVNPGTGVPPYIKSITGISESELENAPSFYEIKDQVLDMFLNSVLVAHNVRFDYGFLKNEFKRIDVSFYSRHFCSIRLAKQLFPQLNHYNLDSIIEYFEIKCKRRHRAFDDAQALFDFYSIAQQSVSQSLFGRAVDRALKKPSVPLHMSEDSLEKLPESSGVYIFYGEDNYPIYIGKSVNIRDRVLSHFSNEHSSAKEIQISTQVRAIEPIKTAGELGALLLESTLIKKYQPIYNQQLRYARKMIILLRSQDDNGYSTVEVKEVEQLGLDDIKDFLGAFRSIKQLQNHLYQLAKEYCLCPKLLELDKSKDSCFYYHLDICRGACRNKEKSISYNIRFSEAFYKYKIRQWMFESPIIIKEKGEGEDGFVVDKWCLLGSIKSDSDLEDIKLDYIFDLDAYKILTRFILTPTKNISIKKINLPFLKANLSD